MNGRISPGYPRYDGAGFQKSPAKQPNEGGEGHLQVSLFS